MKKMKRFWGIAFLFVLMAVPALSGIAWAGEFTADLVMNMAGNATEGKVWVKDQKMRQDITSPQGSVTIIIDLDQGFQWVLMPDSKSYMKNKVESKGKGFRPDNFNAMQQGQMQAKIEKSGSEKVNGYKCDKYLINFDNAQMGTMTTWFSEDLGYPIKSLAEGSPIGKVTTELQNIKKGGVSDDQFEIPGDYTEMKMPAMPQGTQ